MRVTVDEDTRTLTLREEDQPPRTVTVGHEHWQLKQTKRAKHLRFGAEAVGLTLHGALYLEKDGRVAGHLKLREGERQKSHYALTTRPTPSGPAGLFYIHTDHLDTPQVLSDDNQVIVWQADYTPFGEATLTKDNPMTHILMRTPQPNARSETLTHLQYARMWNPRDGSAVTWTETVSTLHPTGAARLGHMTVPVPKARRQKKVTTRMVGKDPQRELF